MHKGNINMKEKKTPILVTSSYGSGTTWIGKMPSAERFFVTWVISEFKMV